MLHKSITENWEQPPSIQHKQQRQERRAKDRFAAAKLREADEEILELKRQRSKRKQRLLVEWANASESKRRAWIRLAAERETSERVAELIRQNPTPNNHPRVQILDVLAGQLELPAITQIEPTGSD